MENNRFKVKYIRLNEPCKIVIQCPDLQNDYDFNVGEIYFKEYDDTFDIFFITGEKMKLYLKAINMQKSIYGDTIMFHINTLKSGYYKIHGSSIRRRLDEVLDLRSVKELEKEIYGQE